MQGNIKSEALEIVHNECETCGKKSSSHYVIN